MISLIIVEDQRILLESMSIALGNVSDITVIRSYTDASELLCSSFLRKADVILMDIYTENNSNGIEVCAQLTGKYQDLKIILITGMPSLFNMDKAKKSGAYGLVHKNLPFDELVKIIRNAAAADPDTAFQEEPAQTIDWLSQITPREYEILKKTCQGKGRRTIATELFLSESTIKSDITKLLRKTGHSKISSLAVFLLSNGYIPSNLD